MSGAEIHHRLRYAPCKEDDKVQARFGSWWRDLLDSLWFTPAVIALLYALLALMLLQLDRSLELDQAEEAWAAGGPDGARGILFAIAGTSLSIIGVVFSITVIALQIASAQFTPRVMRTFTGDRGIQVVLGVFLGTVTYALLVLRAVRTPDEAGESAGFVPVTAVAVAIGLTLVSIAFMIYYIHHVARSVQVAVILVRITDDTLELLDEYVLDGDSAAFDRGRLDEAAGAEWTTVVATADGYLDAVDPDALLAVADEGGLTIRTRPVVGEFVLHGAVLAHVWPASAVDASGSEAIRDSFVLGPERTRQQDAELGVRQLADIAIKALSPAINDPTTATLCIDRLAQLLVRAGSVAAEAVVEGTRDSRVAVRQPPFARLVDVAFTQIRRYGAGDPVVSAHLMAAMGEIAARVPAERREPLRRQAVDLVIEARQRLVVATDLERVEAAGRWHAES